MCCSGVTVVGDWEGSGLSAAAAAAAAKEDDKEEDFIRNGQ
jgi:hypothetical protein